MQYMMYKATDKVTDKAEKINKPVYHEKVTENGCKG